MGEFFIRFNVFSCPPDIVDDCCVVLSENPADCLIWVIGFVTENF